MISTASTLSSPWESLLPRPRVFIPMDGVYRLPARPRMRIGHAAERLSSILPSEWQSEFSARMAVETVPAPGYGFSISDSPKDPLTGIHAGSEAYALEISPSAIRAGANTYAGLVHAWQSLKQMLRQAPDGLPGGRLDDWPTLDWRIYHVDLKGTRRRYETLMAMLPILSEFKINAILVEYENHIRLERHPSLAFPDALNASQVAEWNQAAADYGITIIPLVQTLGHLQYALNQAPYSDLQEHPGDPAEACPLHPGTWPLIRDFLDEIMAMHPEAPFIHAGLDEAFHFATCPRCRRALETRSRGALFADWVNRVCGYIREHGQTPMVWADMMLEQMDPGIIADLNRDAVYVEWGYHETGPSSPWLQGTPYRPRLSRQWLCRPEGETACLPSLYLTPGSLFFEDLPREDRETVQSWADHPGFPAHFRTGIGLRRLRDAGFKGGAVSGIRVSFHGNIAPKFITGQLNTIQWAEACRAYSAPVLVGSSWSRGGSFAGINAHPELDWYGVATLADAGWSNLDTSRLRDFDRRFAFQFFGLPDGTIGDLYFLHERTDSRVDHRMNHYLEMIKDRGRDLIPGCRRRREHLELFLQVVHAQSLRFRAQFALLELEYFYATWDQVLHDFRNRIERDIQAVLDEAEHAQDDLACVYARTLTDADARELARTQLAFFTDSLRLMAQKQFGKAFPASHADGSASEPAKVLHPRKV